MKLKHSVEKLTEIIFKTDGDVKNQYVPDKAFASFVEEYGNHIISNEGIEYDISSILRYVCPFYNVVNDQIQLNKCWIFDGFLLNFCWIPYSMLTASGIECRRSERTRNYLPIQRILKNL